jgi:cyclophilin family peptidyl-prolyl cis-trans isomerase
MLYRQLSRMGWLCFIGSLPVFAGPVIDPIPGASIPAGKSLIIPVTASSSNGRPLTFTATSSTNKITVEVHTNNPFWKMSVVQAAPMGTPGSFPTPYRGGVVNVTNIGDMTFMLFKDIAPHTVDVIQGLTASGFYTGNTIFHRVVSGFVIQGGDPQTNGTGGPVFRYDDEFNPRALFGGNGQLALANSGKDTDGSQFFVTIGPQRFLDLGYTLFGQLLRGSNVLTIVGATPTDAGSRPLSDVIITRASFVPDTTDTVLTLAGTNSAGVPATIKVIADDGAGGRTTNTFTATTVADGNNEPPILFPATVTNLVGAVNAHITNTAVALDLEGNALTWKANFLDQTSFNAASNSTVNSASGQLVIVPVTGYSGPVNIYIAVSQDGFATYDIQDYTFAIGDTAISAVASNFVALPLTLFSNQLLATFTNGVPNSATNNFTASINWGDNVITGGVISSNLSGRKEVRGSHTYTNSGTYPVYITIQSTLGATATVVSTANVPPNLSLARSGTTNILRWPAFASDYFLQSQTNLLSANWVDVAGFPALVGYENVVTNNTTAGNFFFRLKK